MMSPLGMGLDTATLLSTSIEGVLYGISLVFYGGTMWALTHGRPKDDINWSMALVASIFLVLSTVHLVIDIQRLVYGFISEPGIFPADFFADMSQRTFVIKSIIYVLQTLLSDGVVIYRCYIVWQRPAFLILPVVLWCAALVTSSGLLYNLLYATVSKNVFLLGMGKWVILFFLLTMATNVFSSALLAYGISSIINRSESGVTRVPPRSGIDGLLVLRVLVDSAALYTLALFVLLVCCAYKNTGRFIILDMMTPIISISFYMVLVRIAIARNDPGDADSEVLSSLHFATALPSPSEPTFTIARRSSI